MPSRYDRFLTRNFGGSAASVQRRLERAGVDQRSLRRLANGHGRPEDLVAFSDALRLLSPPPQGEVDTSPRVIPTRGNRAIVVPSDLPRPYADLTSQQRRLARFAGREGITWRQLQNSDALRRLAGGKAPTPAQLDRVQSRAEVDVLLRRAADTSGVARAWTTELAMRAREDEAFARILTTAIGDSNVALPAAFAVPDSIVTIVPPGTQSGSPRRGFRDFVDAWNYVATFDNLGVFLNLEWDGDVWRVWVEGSEPFGF